MSDFFGGELLSSGAAMLTGTGRHQDIYAHGLSVAHRWFTRMVDPDYALQEDADTWRRIWRDAKIAQAMQTRMHWVAGRNWNVVPGAESPTEKDEIAAAIVKQALKQIRGFADARALMAQYVFGGVAYNFIEGKRKLLRLHPKTQMAAWWVPRKLRHIDKRRIWVAPERIEKPGGHVEVVDRLQISSLLMPHQKVTMSDSFRRRLVRIAYMDEESRLGYGRGLLESIYFLWWAKQEIIKEGMKGIEKWATGIAWAKVDMKGQAGKTGRDADSARAEWLKVLDMMRARHSLVFDKDDEFGIETGGNQGGGLIMEWMKYIDDSILGLVLGSALPFGGASDAGSLARAREEKDTSTMLIDFNREALSEEITETVIRYFWRMNAPQLHALGLAGAALPRFEIVRRRESDPDTEAGIVGTLHQAGVDLRADEVAEKTGYTPVSKEDRTQGNVIPGASPAESFGGDAPFDEELFHDRRSNKREHHAPRYSGRAARDQRAAERAATRERAYAGAPEYGSSDPFAAAGAAARDALDAAWRGED